MKSPETKFLCQKTELSDEELVRLIQSGACPAAVGELLLRHFEAMSRLLLLWGKRARLRRPDREDVCQEVLTRLLEASSKYDVKRAVGPNRCSFRTFLGALARDRFRDVTRTLRRFERHFDRSVPVEVLLDEEAAGRPSRMHGIKRTTMSVPDDPITAADRREFLVLVDAALLEFDGTARGLWERLADDASLPTIAPLLGLSYDQGKRLRERLHEALRHRLRDWQT
jgi:RNA polymerase sigma factor (sigma-70 family)